MKKLESSHHKTYTWYRSSPVVYSYNIIINSICNEIEKNLKFIEYAHFIHTFILYGFSLMNVQELYNFFQKSTMNVKFNLYHYIHFDQEENVVLDIKKCITEYCMEFSKNPSIEECEHVINSIKTMNYIQFDKKIEIDTEMKHISYVFNKKITN